MEHVLTALAQSLSRLPDRILVSLAHFITLIVFDGLRIRRSLMLRNIDTAFGSSKSAQEKEQIARQSIFNFILSIFETMISIRKPIAERIEVRGGEHLRAALAEGRGVYILCFHLGNWEAMGAKVTRAFKPAYVVVKKVGGKGTNRFVERLRFKNGFYWIRRERAGDGMRGIREVLDRGEIVGFVIDQARPGEPRLPFFGTPAKTNTSFAAIWARRPAPVVPGYMHRTAFGEHVMEFEPALNLVTSDNRSDDILQHSELFNRVVEGAVRKYPEHYFWLHNRWK
ncbi:MAG TPA: lysophospholipid acyltransferase family protein [Oligoflexus sp.]|uniref:lysophospholipid acyltransferase family protein n=1 Tax=Oligoflexus sp. TaxID=1971216 RepID=UPI002D63BD65|nr:lysophospholipid acyltransferase family protein [Oligoflexus sp.]HYX31641.1 lysophospholipid acyltransferase family protein [Oligoflexus sp.]